MGKTAKKKTTRKVSSESEEFKEEIEEEDEPLCKTVSKTYLKLDIIIELPSKEKELVQEFKVPINDEESIELPSLVARLKGLGYPLEGTFVYYYSNELDVNVYCGYDPLPKQCTIPKDDYNQTGVLKLRFKEGLRSEYCDNTKDS